METFLSLIGYKGMIAFIGIMVFLPSYKYSLAIFDWIERQTFGTRIYILEKLELLQIKVNPDHITYSLLGLSFGLSLLTLTILGVLFNWFAALFLAGLVFFIGWKIPKPFINNLVNKRIVEYENQMVDALTLLANGVRAGLSVPQALGMVVSELSGAISQEFNLVLQQNRVGVPLEECFENLAKRITSEDNDMFVTSINILRETGGNLAETFDTIVGVIRERIRIKQRISVMIAQGKIQAYMMASMPFIMGALFASSDPKMMASFLSTPIGYAVLIAALLLDFIGLWIILKIINIKV